MKLLVRWISPSRIAIFFFILTIPIMNFNHHRYAKDEGVIIWDIKSYYAYLPAVCIYHDIHLDFIDNNPSKFGKWIWPVQTPTGDKAILTTMGLSVLYSPFFFIAHLFASISNSYEADGYSLPYHIALTFSVYVYFIIALFFLRKLLLKYFSELSATLTLFAIGAGTNLLYYLTYEAPMSHGYNFSLIILFLFVLDKWSESYSWENTILLGLISGLISLIRPTNTIILLFIPLYRISSLRNIKNNLLLFIRAWPKILVMAVFFILVWIPQFLYWKEVSGKFLYFSYGEVGSSFYFKNPQIFNVLFSYKKGLYLYTPIILFSTIGIIFLFKQRRINSFATLLFFLLNLYILSSWWSWWFGGGYSNRAYIDSYGIMAFPFAALIEYFSQRKRIKIVVIAIVILLIFMNLFQIRQYRNLAIHYYWMNKEAYWENFLRLKPTCKYWHILNSPDIEMARKGIYKTTPYIDNKIQKDDLFKEIDTNLTKDSVLIDSLEIISWQAKKNFEKIKTEYINKYIDSEKALKEYKKLRIEYIKNQMKNCTTWRKEIERKAKRNNLTFDQLADREANRIFKKYSQKYLKGF